MKLSKLMNGWRLTSKINHELQCFNVLIPCLHMHLRLVNQILFRIVCSQSLAQQKFSEFRVIPYTQQCVHTVYMQITFCSIHYVRIKIHQEPALAIYIALQGSIQALCTRGVFSSLRADDSSMHTAKNEWLFDSIRFLIHQFHAILPS